MFEPTGPSSQEAGMAVHSAEGRVEVKGKEEGE